MFVQSEVDEILKKNNIVDVVREYAELKKGDKSYIGKCLFDDKGIEGMVVNEDKQIFHCVCCGVNGNVADFLMQKNNINFPDAIKMLADRVGSPMPSLAPENKESRRLLDLNKEAAKFYNKMLSEGKYKEGLSYLKDTRHLSDKTIKQFALGYAPKGNLLKKHLNGLGYTDTEIINAGLAKEHPKYGVQDCFYNRVIFPVVTSDREVVGFGGRVMGDGEPKYLNTRETDVFHKKENLYGFNRAFKFDKMIFCEGYLDVISMQQAGYKCAVASLGTAITPEQVKMAGDREIYLAYDNDEAGKKATAKALNIVLSQGKSGKVIDLSPCKDPDEYITKFGSDKFSDRVYNSKDGIVFLIEQVIEKYPDKESWKDDEFKEDMLKVINAISDPSERDKVTAYFNKIEEPPKLDITESPEEQGEYNITVTFDDIER